MKRSYKCGDCAAELEPNRVVVRQVSYYRGTLGKVMIRSRRTGYFCERCTAARTHKWKATQVQRRPRGEAKVEGR